MLIPDPRHLDRQLLVGQIPSRADGSSAHGPVIAPLEHTGRRSVLQLESELQSLFPDSKGGDRRRRRFLRTIVCAERTRQRPDFDRFAEQQRRRARRASGPLRAQVGARLTRQSTATENRTKSGGNSVRQLTSIPSRRSPPPLRIAAPTNRVCRVVCTAFSKRFEVGCDSLSLQYYVLKGSSHRPRSVDRLFGLDRIVPALEPTAPSTGRRRSQVPPARRSIGRWRRTAA